LVKKLAATLACCLFCLIAAAQGSYAPVAPGKPLRFPQDTGSHPAFRTEWWYVTGWLTTADGRPLGFQITFFRTKPAIDDANPSTFTPHQLMIAHCALSDPQRGRLWQDQRIRRAGLGLAGADEGNAHAWIEGWTLVRQGSIYVAKIAAEDFGFDLILAETQPPLINGEEGVSRKGPGAGAASYYYSLPNMRVAGSISRQGSSLPVTGEAWFDHEWSSEYLDAQAAGWDWIGLDLDGGGALMAFQIRALDGNPRWAGGTLRAADGTTQMLSPGEVEFRPGRRWTSPRTGISYPVEWDIRAGSSNFHLNPLIDDQENDTRLSTGAIYWEGAVRALHGDTQAGRGYLELTGYGERLRLR
jgi:predicted secreted hydrolase